MQAAASSKQQAHTLVLTVAVVRLWTKKGDADLC
jgi:hypothetical protein